MQPACAVLGRRDQLSVAQPPRLVPRQPIGEPERMLVLIEREDDTVRDAVAEQEMLESRPLTVPVRNSRPGDRAGPLRHASVPWIDEQAFVEQHADLAG